MVEQDVSIIINKSKESSNTEDKKEDQENLNKGSFSIESEDDGYPD